MEVGKKIKETMNTYKILAYDKFHTSKTLGNDRLFNK